MSAVGNQDSKLKSLLAGKFVLNTEASVAAQHHGTLLVGTFFSAWFGMVVFQ